MKKPLMMVMSSGVAVGVGLALIALYSSCGSTHGGANTGSAAFGQFVSNSCSPEGQNGGGSCLSLAAPSSVPADGKTISGFRAQLVDGSGIGLGGVQICFAFENPGVARIIEPTNACGLTDGNGFVSGQFQDGTQNGSFALVATAQAGFGLQARRTISFGGGTGGLAPGAVSQPCATDSDCNSALFCSFNDDLLPWAVAMHAADRRYDNPVLRERGVRVRDMLRRHVPGEHFRIVLPGGACTASAQCGAGFCCDTTGTPANVSELSKSGSYLRTLNCATFLFPQRRAGLSGPSLI